MGRRHDAVMEAILTVFAERNRKARWQTRLESALRGPLATARTALARSPLAARLAVRVRDQMNGIVWEHLGHDIDMTRNGELWILEVLGKDCQTFVDVGANVGNWTAQMLRQSPRARGVLVEPSLSAGRRLTERYAANRNLFIVSKAASDVCGTVDFFEEPDAGQTSSLAAGFSRPTAERRKVATVTVDQLLVDHQVDVVDYLKIDAEGYDLHVLRGAAASLRAQRIRAVQFEYNEPWQRTGSRLGDALSLLGDMGYRPLLLKGHGLYVLPYEVYGEYYHYSNFIAVPDARWDEVREHVRRRI